MKLGWRSNPKDMKSLAFDVYIYSNGKGGRVICRQTKEDMKFNDYKAEKNRIIEFIDSEYEKKFTCEEGCPFCKKEKK